MAGYLIHESSGVTAYWMQKSGCTLLKNVFYALAMGQIHPDPMQIHWDQEAIARIKFRKRKHLLLPEKAFVVIREPGNRILSFYWDKIFSEGPYAMPRLRTRIERLVRRRHDGFEGFYVGKNASLDQHRRNVQFMLDGIEVAFNNRDDGFVNGHFAQQSQMVIEDGASSLPLVPLENLHSQIPSGVRESLPQLVDVVEAMPKLNESKKEFSNKELMDNEIQGKIDRLYVTDQFLHRAARQNSANALCLDDLR